MFLQILIVFILYVCSSFFKAGNYQAAISAFSHAIRLSPKMAAYPLQLFATIAVILMLLVRKQPAF